MIKSMRLTVFLLLSITLTAGFILFSYSTADAAVGSSGNILTNGAFSDTPAAERQLLRFPAIFENTIVFTYASDLWVGDLKTGSSRRLTSHQGSERLASISPDGKSVAFVASYDGDADIYVMPLEGGEPKRITYDSYGESFVGWTPDGKIYYASGAGTFTAGQRRLWMIDATGGLPIETPVNEFNAGTFFAGGQRIAYNRTDSYAYNWRNYRGGRIGTISIYDLSNNKYSELPNAGANSWFPMAVGDAIYFLSDRSQKTANLYKYDSSTNKDVQLTRYSDYDIKNPKTDGKSIVYERDGFLYLFDIASGKDRKLTFKIQNDNLAARPYITKVGQMINNVSVTPDASKIAVEARGEVFSLSTGNANAQNLTNTPGIRERAPAWSPDGQSLAYLSDASGEFQIYKQSVGSEEARQISDHRGLSIRGFLWSPNGQRILYYTENFGLFTLDVNTRASTRIFQTEYAGRFSFDWSPDSQWVAVSATGKNGLSSIYLYDVKSGKLTRMTSGLYDDSNVAFDLTGKYLYFTSAREFQPSEGRFEQSLKVEKADRVYLIPLRNDVPNPLSDLDDIPAADAESNSSASDVRIDFEGFAERAVVLPVPAGDVVELIGAKNGVLQNDGDTLRKFDLKSKEQQTIYDASGVNVVLNQDKTKAAYYGENTLGVFDVKPGVKTGTGKVDTNGLEARVVPQEEWKQIFWEAWRFERDQFFRADMEGVDWQAVGRHYEQFLPQVNNWSDMRYVLGLMLGELGSSHAYVNEPPADDASSNIRPSRAAMLGADFQKNGQSVQFKKIYAGTSAQNAFRSPLGEQGINVKAGDYLLEIDGQAVNAGINPNSLLINRAGKVVTLTVNQTASLQGARKVKVKPVADETNLRYYEWIEANRRKVEELSGGRIGYIHYPNTGRVGQAAFIGGFYAQSDKDAVILDGRFNGGGSPQPMVLQTLGRTSPNEIKFRSWVGGTDLPAINGPKAMLTNKYAGSGGDLTPWMFRYFGMGKIIGTRTMGAQTGIQEQRTLLNGGGVTAPGYRRFDRKTGELIVENKGVEPDITVDNTPDIILQGRDAQLEAAVKILLEQLK
jgi:tricorn protease